MVMMTIAFLGVRHLQRRVEDLSLHCFVYYLVMSSFYFQRYKIFSNLAASWFTGLLELKGTLELEGIALPAIGVSLCQRCSFKRETVLPLDKICKHIEMKVEE